MLRKVTLICVGSLKKRYLKELERAYLDCIHLVTVKDSNINHESEEILKILNGSNNKFCVLFDLKGKRLEECLRSIQNGYVTNENIFFIVGGSNGVNESLRRYCNVVVKLSNFTYSHQIFRISSLIFIRDTLFKV